LQKKPIILLNLFITFDAIQVTTNFWGFRILENTVFAIVDNSNEIAIFNGFFNIPDGSIVGPTNLVTVAGNTRTHGI